MQVRTRRAQKSSDAFVSLRARSGEVEEREINVVLKNTFGGSRRAKRWDQSVYCPFFHKRVVRIGWLASVIKFHEAPVVGGQVSHAVRLVDHGLRSPWLQKPHQATPRALWSASHNLVFSLVFAGDQVG